VLNAIIDIIIVVILGKSLWCPSMGDFDRFSRVLSKVKYLIYIVIVFGLIVYLYSVSSSISRWVIEPSSIPEIMPQGVSGIKIDMIFRVYNPGERVTAKLVYYRIYIDGNYVGDGFIPYLNLDHGWSEHRVIAYIDLTRVGCGTTEAILRGGGVNISIAGYAMVDIYLFGKIPWRSVTIPFNKTLANINVPRLDENSISVIKFYDLICRNGPKIIGFLSKVASASLKQVP